MLMHTDYFSPACPRVRIFTNHIEFYNPGGLPKPFEELKGKDISLPRNPIIAKLFRMVKLAENIGFGFDKIDDNWKAYNSTMPDYQIEFDSVVVDFKMEAQESVRETSGKTSGKIIELIQGNENISIPEMAETIGVSERSVERNIENLKKKGLLKRIGPAKGGYWQVID
ncbi:winged helix-turn-helix transcriptional regulator [Maribellus luteus]|uniref:Winged helix-turn-helix transcriptional regulator n=2 Tax=Maribellus luteus TaxID=2305463 RepID=A0A399T889_9BACT|nr:winged helix-turn-helix transcriptional regulator [Maribellus luteus]